MYLSCILAAALAFPLTNALCAQQDVAGSCERGAGRDSIGLPNARSEPAPDGISRQRAGEENACQAPRSKTSRYAGPPVSLAKLSSIRGVPVTR